MIKIRTVIGQCTGMFGQQIPYCLSISSIIHGLMFLMFSSIVGVSPTLFMAPDGHWWYIFEVLINVIDVNIHGTIVDGWRQSIDWWLLIVHNHDDDHQ